jgi:hypothetical protein
MNVLDGLDEMALTQDEVNVIGLFNLDRDEFHHVSFNERALGCSSPVVLQAGDDRTAGHHRCRRLR